MDFCTVLMQLRYCLADNGLGTTAHLLMQSINLYVLRSNFILWRRCFSFSGGF